jgi:hypothetical protein
VGHFAEVASGYADSPETTATAGAATSGAASASSPTLTLANSGDSWDANVRHETAIEPGTGTGFADGLDAFFSSKNELFASPFPLAAGLAAASPASGNHAAMGAEDMAAHTQQPLASAAPANQLAAAPPPNSGEANVASRGGLDTAASTFPPLLQPIATSTAQRPPATNLPLQTSQITPEVAARSAAPVSLVGALGPNASRSTPLVAHGAWFEAAVDATGFTFTPTTGSGSVAVQFVGTNPSAPVAATAATPATTAFFAAADALARGAGSSSYAAVTYHDVYPGIDLQYNPTANQNLEYSFVVQPGADPGAIRLGFQGASGLHLSRTAKVFSQDGLQPEVLGVYPCSV